MITKMAVTKSSEGATAFAHQMSEMAATTVDPIEAMTMRVASEMMAVLPRHANTRQTVDTLMQAMPSICISLIETVAATAYQGDMVKTREATLVLLQKALSSYDRPGARRIEPVRTS